MLKPKLQKRFTPGEQPCPFCGNIGREIIAQAPTERISIRETNIAVLQTLERNLRYLLASIAVTVVAPIIIPQFHLNEPIPAIISIIAGLVAFILGIYGVVLVKRIRES
jgi:hypothetical protein